MTKAGSAEWSADRDESPKPAYLTQEGQLLLGRLSLCRSFGSRCYTDHGSNPTRPGLGVDLLLAVKGLGDQLLLREGPLHLDGQ